jgi:two-component system, LytTR family, sensor kinase
MNFHSHDRSSSLTHLLYQTGWMGKVVGVLIGITMFYGVSGVVHFTGQIATTTDPALRAINQYIVINNIIGAVITVLLTNWLSGYIEKWTPSLLLQHFILTNLILLAYFGQMSGAYFQFGEQMLIHEEEANRLQTTDDAPWYWYILSPIFVANAFMYFRRQGRLLTRRITEQEYQLSELEKSKTKAELEALQAKINPHFLYNSLNSIASLVHHDPDKAEQMTLLLSKLFRYVTNKTADYFDTLANELEMVATYLEIEQVRFGDRLSFRIVVKDNGLKSAQIPRFLIQPIVENAIKHGISKISGNGIIEVRVTPNEQHLCISIHDNGPAFSDSIQGGYGLQSIQNKLRLLYGSNASLTLQNEPHKQVIVELPLNQTSTEFVNS